MPTVSSDVEISLTFDLFELPTAQHKAGFAGLLLLIASLRGRGISPLPHVNGLTPTSVALTLNEETLQAVFDDLYDAEWQEIESKAKRKRKGTEIEPKREQTVEQPDPKTGKVKKTKMFIYDAVVPKASFLEHHYPGDEHGWLKLWRDMLWTTLRGRDKTRLVYKERADKKPSREGSDAWKELVGFTKNNKTGKLVVGEIPSSLFVGAQAYNAEKVPFNGRVDQNFLLHFWPLTVQVFIPQVIKRDKKGQFRQEEKGYVLAIPEVTDLKEFCDVFPLSLAALDPQTRGYRTRPRASLIDLPAEGGLEFLRHLSLIAQQRAGRGNLKYSVSAIELYHLDKQGNNIKMLAADKLIPRA
ncbi:MAG: type I-MYXAN CRISPR-associated protein Cmx8, partial [Nitrososphaera sp.]|nr:type I-MYXAN CRISPR-associated protein Cmx8 [Nitrososphaera sp.]